MSNLADYDKIGLLPLRDHQANVKVYERSVLYGGEVESRDEHTGQYELHEEKVGDIVCALSWLPEKRDTGAWAFLWPAVAGVPSPSARKVVTREGGSAYEASGFEYLPILGGKGYPADVALKKKTMPPGQTPASWPSFPTGYVLAVVAGTETAKEHPVVLSADPRLVAVNAKGDPTMSTTVVDLKDPNEIDDERQAPLHSVWRVIKEPQGVLAYGPRNPIAWQLAGAGQDGSTGWGMIYAELDKGSGGGVTTPTNDAGSGAYAAPGGAAPGSAGAGGKKAACGIGIVSNKGRGPFKLGTADDQHVFGHDADGHPIMSTHIDTDAYFHMSREKDGPLYFERTPWPRPPDLPFQSLVHLVYDPALSHPSLGRSGVGKWRWYSSYSMGSTPTKNRTPEKPPITPGDPVPPTPPPTTPPDHGYPSPPSSPTPTDPVTPRGPGASPDAPTPAPSVSEPDGGGLFGPDEPPYYSGPPISPGTGPGIPGIDLPGRDGRNGWGGSSDLPGSSANPPGPGEGFDRYGTDGRPRDVRPWSPEDGAKPVMGAVTEHAFPAVLFRPQSMNSASKDLRTGVSPSPWDVERENTRPVVARLESWGAMVGGEWGFTTRDGKGKYGFSGSGGVIVTVPEQDVTDADDDFSTPDRDLSSSYFAVARGVSFAAAIPNPRTGGMRDGYRWSAPSTSLVFEALDADGAAQTALTMDANGGVILGGKFGLGGVLTPSAIGAHQNNYNPGGMIRAGILRVSSSAAYNITGLAGGADDRMLVVTNVGAFTITLKNSDASSTAANRFLFGADLALAAEESVWLTYDNTSARWRLVSRTTASSGGGVSDADYGDVVVSSSGTVWTIDAGVVTLAKMANLATDRLIGRDTAGTGVPEALTVGGGIEFTGSGGIQTSALTGDVTKSAGGTALTIANDAVTYAKMQNVSATDKVLGRSTAGAGDVEEIACTAAGRALIDDADAAAQRTTLGLGGAAVLNVGTAAGTVAAGDDARFVGQLLGHTDAATDIVSNAAEATLWSASIADMASGDRVRVRIVGDYLNNSGATRTGTLKIKFGSTTLIAVGTPTQAASATRRSWFLDFEIAAYGSTSAQESGGTFQLGGVSNAATGTAILGLASTIGSLYGAAASEDTTSAKTFSVTWQHSANNASLSMRLKFATLNKFKA